MTVIIITTEVNIPPGEIIGRISPIKIIMAEIISFKTKEKRK